jgi:MerR family copper efflux transcriptional regulator
LITVSTLARQCGISRTTLLYYEKQKLLQPSMRGANGYRYYNENEVECLQKIIGYRSAGLPIADIRRLLAAEKGGDHILQSHFFRIEQAIQSLRRQQYAIVNLLRLQISAGTKKVNKTEWVTAMREAGMSDEDMDEWHRLFESMVPAEHEAFLKMIGCGPAERKSIRADAGMLRQKA